MTDLVSATNRLRHCAAKANLLAASSSVGRLPAGGFEGYASIFNFPDAGGDMVLPGAFAESLAKRGPQNIRMLFQHDPGQPIGIWQEIREDRRGLFVRGQLSLDVSRACELAGLLEDGAIDGLSIGFKTIKARRNPRSGIRQLHRVDLWEISLVTFPMLSRARISRTGSRPVR